LDYTRSHAIAATSAAIENIRFEVVPHPPYSPDLALSDFWLFGNISKEFIPHVLENSSLYGKMVSRTA
jgi:hypothetical protein